MESISVLVNVFEDPLMYSIFFLIYVILAAIILPIPVEIGLFNPNINPEFSFTLTAYCKSSFAFCWEAITGSIGASSEPNSVKK